MKYYIDCKTSYACYQEPEDTDDKWGYRGEYGHEDHQFIVTTKKLDYPEETFETNIDDPHFIAVIYSDGDTFGRTRGLVQYIGPFTRQEANTKAEQLENSNGCSYQDLVDWSEKNDGYFYPYWTGYFTDYERCQVISLGE